MTNTTEKLSKDVLFEIYKEVQALHDESSFYRGHSCSAANPPVKNPKTKKQIDYSTAFYSVTSRLMAAIEKKNTYEALFNAPTDNCVVQMKNPHLKRLIFRDGKSKLSFYNHDSFNESMRTSESYKSFWFFDLRKK